MSDDGAEKPTPANVGGQAVIEGVMMRAPGSVAIVVRRRNGSLVIRERSVPSRAKGPTTWPFMRGMLTLFSSLRLGSRSLRWSVEILERDLAEEDRQAELALARQEKAARRAKAAKAKGAAATSRTAPSPGALPPSILTLTALAIARVATLTGQESDEPDLDSDESEDERPAPAALGAAPPLPPPLEKKEGSKLLGLVPIVFAVGLFILLPQGAAELINRVFKLGLVNTSPGYQVITGIAKLVIIVSYLSLIRLNGEIRRVFQYHGAEHKAISTYEHGRDLIVEEAKPMTTLHARCGTTFLIMVAFVSVVIFSVAGAVLQRYLPPIHFVVFFLMKLPLLPLIAGLTYEIQRVLARYCSTGPLRVLLWPGFIVQKITTAEPDPMQLETALASLRAALAHAKVKLPEDHPDQTFATYGKLIGDPAFTSPTAAAT